MTSKYTLGIHLGHDRAVSILKDNELVAHLAQERIDRIKKSSSYKIPFETIDSLLAYLDISVKDVGLVGVSYINFDLKNYVGELEEEFCRYYEVTNIKFIDVKHHLAHAYSCFFTSGFDESLVFVADGAGDPKSIGTESESLFHATHSKVKLLDYRLQEDFIDLDQSPFYYKYHLMSDKFKSKEISLGRKYEQVTYLLGFSPFQEGKTMAMASYGKCLDGLNDIDVNNLDFRLTNGDVLDLIDSHFMKSKESFQTFVDKRKFDIAKTVQTFLENTICNILTSVGQDYPDSNLCLSGGVFLNCVMNQKITELGLFKNIFFMPAAGDDGQSIGAAFFAYKEHYESKCSFESNLPYLGIEYENKEVYEAIEQNDGIQYQELAESDLVEELARSICDGNIIAVLRGRSELGPRALGNRSIFANPTIHNIREHLNNSVKKRETFRPFAPVVVSEEQFKYFDLEEASPFMLLAPVVKEKYREKLPGITHVDNTARVQAVEKSKNPFLHRLLYSVKKTLNFPILLNTSFNLSDEPMVESPKDALLTFLRSNIDVLVINNILIKKRVLDQTDFRAKDKSSD